MTDIFAMTVGLLAEEAPRNRGPDFGKASPFGLLIIVLLSIGTFALIWSMNRHLKKLPDHFDREHPEPDQAADEGTVELAPDAEPDGVGPAPDAPPDSEESRHESGG